MPIEMDDIDRRILRELQKDGRVQNNELARRVGLSPSPCLRRVKLLEEAGVISRYVAVVDQAKVGLGLSMFVKVWLLAQDTQTIEVFIKAMQRLPEVVECYIMLGESDALMKVVVSDIEDYRRFQRANLTRQNGIQNVKTDVPSEVVKQAFALPV
jgi:Lrp/AsnC family leucine-responsive transcriptional regulator